MDLRLNYFILYLCCIINLDLCLYISIYNNFWPITNIVLIKLLFNAQCNRMLIEKVYKQNKHKVKYTFKEIEVKASHLFRFWPILC